MRTQRTAGMIMTVLALATLVAGAVETKKDGKATVAREEIAHPEKEVPEPSSALIGAIGLLILLGRRR